MLRFLEVCKSLSFSCKGEVGTLCDPFLAGDESGVNVRLDVSSVLTEALRATADVSIGLAALPGARDSVAGVAGRVGVFSWAGVVGGMMPSFSSSSRS